MRFFPGGLQSYLIGELDWRKLHILADLILQEKREEVYLAVDDELIRGDLRKQLGFLLKKENPQLKIYFLEESLSLGEYFFFKDYKHEKEKVIIYFTSGGYDYFSQVKILGNINFSKWSELEKNKVFSDEDFDFHKFDFEWKSISKEEYEKSILDSIDFKLIRKKEINFFAYLPLPPYKKRWQKLFLELFNQLVFWERNLYDLDLKNINSDEFSNFFEDNGFECGVEFDLSG
jgi:hypothetical protein